jgi:hypothetical protein
VSAVQEPFFRRSARVFALGAALLLATVASCRRRPQVQVTADQCRASGYAGTSSACRECVCQCNPAAAAACGKDCWALLSCVHDRCGNNGENMGCILKTCASFLGAGRAAKALGMCSNGACVEKCMPAKG